MNGMRKLLCFMGVVVAFALSGAAFAQVKNMSVSASPAFVPPGATAATEIITWTNNASGNSNMNSVSLTWQVPAGVTVTFVSADSGTVTNQSATGFSIINMSSIKPGKAFNVRVAITVPADAVCSAASPFTGKAWTGNTLGGTQFLPTSGSVAQVFVGCNGTLACNTPLMGTDLDPVLGNGQKAKWGRGQFDADGSDCSANPAVPFSTDFIFLGTQTFVFSEISNGQHPTVEYVLSWNPVANSGAPITGMPSFQPTVAWLNTAGHPTSEGGTPVPIPAQACLSDDLTNPTAIMPTLPLNVISPYTGGAKAKMCIAEQGWILDDNGNIQYWDRVIDQGDGYVGGP